MTPAEIAHLFSLKNEYRSIKYDLRNIQILLERLGNPHQSFRSVLIAGTNGKGSVAVDVVRNDAGRRAVHFATSAAAEREVQDRQPGDLRSGSRDRLCGSCGGRNGRLRRSSTRRHILK